LKKRRRSSPRKADPVTVLGFIAAKRGRGPVETMCPVLGVSRSDLTDPLKQPRVLDVAGGRRSWFRVFSSHRTGHRRLADGARAPAPCALHRACSGAPTRPASSSRSPSASRPAPPASPNRWDHAATARQRGRRASSRPQKELIHRRSRPLKSELRTELFDYIAVFTIAARQHSTVGNISPIGVPS
jgi:hypothetical protein